MISVEFVIPAWKEEENIKKLIKGIEDEIKKLSSEYRFLNIWVMTHDKATGRCAKEADKLNLVRHVLVPRQKGGKIASLNEALKRVKADIVVFIDGDITLSKDSIKLILDRLTKSKNIHAVVGRPAPLNPKNSMIDFWAHVLTHAAHRMRKASATQKKVVNITGNLYAVKKEFLPKKFDIRCADDAFITFYIVSKGGFIDYEDKAFAYQMYPRNYKDWLLQKLRNLKGEATSKEVIKQLLKNGKKEIESMRTFTKEIRYFYYTLEVPKNFKEWLWFIALYFARLHMWFLHFLNPTIKRRRDSLWFRWKKV